MTDEYSPLREQIDDAIARVSRELDILRDPTNVGGHADNREVIGQLLAELRELKAARARVGPYET